jgi:ADP-ribose pyrophosphatase
MSYTLIGKEAIYKGKKVRLELHHLQDEAGKRTEREICVHPGAVVVLPFVDAQRILLIRNRRYAISEILLELPAGTLEKGEAPMNCAGRELLEETGYLAQRLRPLVHFYTSPGILTERMYAFTAHDLQRRTASLEEGEEIEVVPATLNEAIDMIRDGQIQDGKTIATLLFYSQFAGEMK